MYSFGSWLEVGFGFLGPGLKPDNAQKHPSDALPEGRHYFKVAIGKCIFGMLRGVLWLVQKAHPFAVLSTMLVVPHLLRMRGWRFL
mmetsp:Transcript_62737/g.203278  ORF Transcript_62737/g.203278 Transcript_62737/m.203278 type:complete len:86 (+) Transcript_62737:112-369(+)